MVTFLKSRIKRLVHDFERIAFDLLRQGRQTGSKAVRDRRIRAWLGVSSKTVAKAWDLFCRQHNNRPPEGATKERFLWAFILLKSYDTDEVNAARVGGVDEGTFRKWSWWFVDELANLESEVVSSFVSCLLLFAVSHHVVDCLGKPLYKRCWQ